MRYFRLEQDKRFTDIPYIMNGFNKIDGRKIRRDQSRSLPHRVLMELYPNPNTVFGDIILSPYLLLSEKAREAVNLYEQRLPYKQVVLLDSENALTNLYFLPILEVVDCLSAASEMNRGRTVIRRAVLLKSKLPSPSIFRLDNVDCAQIIVRLDLAESLLRRGVRGIKLRETIVSEEEQ
jgi:hypothetical protein